MRKCKWCGSDQYYQTFCLKRPKQPLKKTPIKKIGKQSRTWMTFRKEYLKLHPPDFDGYYVCYLCGKHIPEAEITLDHKIPRSHAPELRYNEDNIALCCGSCNSSKGSKSLDNYIK